MKTFSYKEIKNAFHNEEPWTNMFIFSYVTIPLVYFMVNFTRTTPNIISYILDATGGKVSQLTKTKKIYGAWFDIFVDRINLTLITIAISYKYNTQTGTIDILLLNSLFLGSAFIGWESRCNIYEILELLKKDFE